MSAYSQTSLNRNEKILDILTKVAADISEPVKNYRLAAAIVLKNSIISFGVNSYKTHPFQARWSKNKHAIHLHAEINAIKNATKKIDTNLLKKSSLYVARVILDNKGSILSRALSMPCSGCQRCIVEFEIRNVIYTTNKGHAYL